MAERWIIVASQKGIKIFTQDEDGAGLSIVKVIPNPLNVARKELIRKQAGMGLKSLGAAGVVRYSQSKKHDPKEEAAIQFAKEVSHFLELERMKKSFEVLTIAAEPHFLGKIKAALALKPSLRDLEVDWINKDLQNTPQKDLSHFLLIRNEVVPETPATAENAVVV